MTKALLIPGSHETISPRELEACLESAPHWRHLGNVTN